MMRQLLLVVLLALSQGTMAQEINKAIIDPDINREILSGWVNREGIASKDYLEDGLLKYDSYEANKDAIAILKEAFKENDHLNILVVFATWCGDSKTHLPDFFKVVDLAQMQNVKYLAVNRKKKVVNMDISYLDIQLVPTFIVYNGKVEIGRIVESPWYSLESDLVEILKK